MTYLRASAAAWTVATILLAACSTRPSPPAPKIDLAGMDKSIAPGDDFNAYTNGGWIKATPIPADKSSYGIDAILTDETRKRTLALIQDGANRQIGDFYASFMDETAIESKGIAPLK